jgi:hypothetical protein
LQRWLRPLVSLVALAALAAAPAGAVVVTYFPRDVADVVPGEDRWEYAFQVDGFASYGAGYGFTVRFDPDHYAALDPDPTVPPQWDAITAEPDPDLGDDGFYDAEALVDAPNAAAVFRVSFVWLGTGTPGAQPFDVREPSPSFEVVESGTTVLPEPAGLSLGASALAALAATRRTSS